MTTRSLETGEPKHTSAGVGGIAHALQYALPEMGVKRSVQALSKVNHVDGFDCPSCAWPDPEDRRTAPSSARTAPRRSPGRRPANASTRPSSPRTRWPSCASQDDHWLEHHGRLAEPMYLAPGATHYAPISLGRRRSDLVADRLRALPDPNRAVFYTSGRASNEAAFAYQLLARRLGTNNLPDCSNMCHESSGAALAETIGIGKGVVTLTDIESHAELIVIVGQNPGTNHPRMLMALEKAKQRGARIVAINPLPEAGLRPVPQPADAAAVWPGAGPSARRPAICRCASTATSRCSPA